MPPNIPIEIAERIIDMLGNDQDTLRQCALTCRTWLPRSRLNLFRSITLRGRPNLYDFVALLDADKFAEHSIRKVNIILQRHAPLFDSFCAVLGHRLPRLLELCLTGGVSIGRCYPHITRRTCLHASRLTSITSLTMEQITLPAFSDLARLLTALVHLSFLAFDSITWLSCGPYSSELISRGSLKLETLHMRATYGPSSCVRTVLRAVNPSSLREVTVDACCAIPHPSSFQWFSADLGNLSALETVNIYMHLDPPPPFDVEGAIDVLSKISSPSLRRVNLDCLHSASGQSRLRRALAAAPSGWQSVFARDEYLFLEEVCLRVLEHDPRLSATLGSSLPQLRDRGILALAVLQGRDDTGEMRFNKRRIQPA